MEYQLLKDEIIEGTKFFRIESGMSCNTPEQIISHLLKKRPDLMEVYSVDECDGILLFCSIVSRAGTDIDAAKNKLNSACSETDSKPVIFMLLHPTFDPDKIVPDSSRIINRMNTLTVDLLFSEDTGLLKCRSNDEALKKIVCHFRPQKKDKWVYLVVVICAIFTIIIVMYLLFKYL